MSKLDFNKPADFALATMSATNELLQAFIRDRAEWAIAEGTYRGGRKNARTVNFHVFKKRSDYQAGLPRMTDEGGRRTAVYRFPYMDGQTTDDLGAEGESFDAEIIFHGPYYKVGMNRLLEEFADPKPGTLEHPVRGVVRAKAVRWTIEHSHDMKNAAMMRVRFTTHEFDGLVIDNLLVIKTPKSALQKVIAAMQKISAAIAAVRQIVGIVNSAVANIRQKIQEFYSAYQSLAADAASAFGMSGADIAAVLPVNQGGNVAPAAAGRTAGGVNPAADPGTFGAGASTAATAGTAGLAVTVGGFIKVSTRFVTVVQPTDPFANLPLDLLGDVARAAIEQTQLAKRVETQRAMVNEIAQDIDDLVALLVNAQIGALGKAAAAVETLINSKVTLLDSSDAMATLIKSGSANGRPVIINYTVPRNMSIREAAFLNKLKPQDGEDISVLNPSLDSVNEIPKGTVLRVPTFI